MCVLILAMVAAHDCSLASSALLMSCSNWVRISSSLRSGPLEAKSSFRPVLHARRSGAAGNSISRWRSPSASVLVSASRSGIRVNPLGQASILRLASITKNWAPRQILTTGPTISFRVSTSTPIIPISARLTRVHGHLARGRKSIARRLSPVSSRPS